MAADASPGVASSSHCSFDVITQRIAQMTDCLSGSCERRWFDHSARSLSRVSRHQAELETRAVDTIRWLFCLYNVPATMTRLVPRLVAQEFTLLVENHRIVWNDLVNWGEAARSRLSPAEAEDLDGLLREPQRQLAYSHEVIYKSAVLWEQLFDLVYLQCHDGGNVYDANVMPEMKLTYQRAYEMRRMLADPPPNVPLSTENERKWKKDMEVVIAHLLEQASTGRFRKRGNVVYEEKMVEWKGARYATGAWVPASFGSGRGDEQHTMESFVLYFCKRDLYPEIFEAMLRCLPVKKAADFLEKCDETAFPFVRPSRHLLSFRNGVYNTQGLPFGSWHEYGQPCVGNAVPNQASAKYFDMPMPMDAFCDGNDGGGSDDWWAIPTPHFQCAPALFCAQHICRK